MSIVRHNGQCVPRDPEPWFAGEQRWQGVVWDDMVAAGYSLSSATWEIPSGWTLNAEEVDVTVIDRYGTTHEHVCRANITAGSGTEGRITCTATFTDSAGQTEVIPRSVDFYVK